MSTTALLLCLAAVCALATAQELCGCSDVHKCIKSKLMDKMGGKSKGEGKACIRQCLQTAGLMDVGKALRQCKPESNSNSGQKPDKEKMRCMMVEAGVCKDDGSSDSSARVKRGHGKGKGRGMKKILMNINDEGLKSCLTDTCGMSENKKQEMEALKNTAISECEAELSQAGTSCTIGELDHCKKRSFASKCGVDTSMWETKRQAQITSCNCIKEKLGDKFTADCNALFADECAGN